LTPWPTISALCLLAAVCGCASHRSSADLITGLPSQSVGLATGEPVVVHGFVDGQFYFVVVSRTDDSIYVVAHAHTTKDLISTTGVSKVTAGSGDWASSGGRAGAGIRVRPSEGLSWANVAGEQDLEVKSASPP
jgi:hypothetical protein